MYSRWDGKVIEVANSRALRIATTLLLSNMVQLLYQYQKLDRERKEIRLLTLEPGSGNDMLRCTLAHAFLDTSHPPAYETILYVCGNPVCRATIILDGSEVEVLATSEIALRRMRLRDKQRILWIDSICIDQTSLEERGHQVGMMYLIYTKTSKNLIWLGPDNGTIEKAIESMVTILDEIEAATSDTLRLNELLFSSTGVPTFS